MLLNQLKYPSSHPSPPFTPQGLPESMKALLQASTLTAAEKQQNPQAVLHALRYLQDPKNHQPNADKYIRPSE